MAIFKRKTVYFQQECEDKTGELIKQQILEKVSVDDCIIAAEMIDVLFIYPELAEELARVLYMSNKNYSERLLCLLAHLKFLYKSQTQRKLLSNVFR